MRKKKLSQQIVEDKADQILVLEANIDDQSAESLAPVLDLLMANGALDAFFSPIQMKKNRPAIKLTVMIHPIDQQTMTYLILKHTTTVGVRYQTMGRTIMPRHFITVATRFGDIRVKIVNYDDIQKYSPEFDDCLAAAKTHGVALNQVYLAAYQSIP
ncbi:nickel pincer cofactor biosynthesis protein LarC2 [Latilactobacillus fragifolii]|uniref:nickel insertion protein n=1 Tax=Latilactobacillus fragifolii TaxID=2814244 RepID=UPI001ABB7A73|nr:nickel insertion protein [Latilactobacillus fragifolii]